MRLNLVWLKLGMTHTARLGQAQLNLNQMRSHVVMATIVQYNTVPAPAGLCPNQFGLLFLPVSPLPSLPWQCAVHCKQTVCKQTVCKQTVDIQWNL